MIGAFRIERAFAIRADRIAVYIFRNRQLSSAISAENRFFVVLVFRPDLRFVSRVFGVALETRKPIAAAFEFYGDDVDFALVMSASRLCVNVCPFDDFAENIHKSLIPRL